MPAPRLPGTFSDGLDLLSRAGYPVRVEADRGALTATRWSADVMSLWLRYAPSDRPDGSPAPSDAHASLVLDDGEWRLSSADDGLPDNPVCGPDGLRLTEDMPDGRSGRILPAGPARAAMEATLARAIATLNGAFEPAPRGPRP